ncbi:hypothetical protein B296_00043529 [Ensete ventricosum]|uniref:Uncharacterized protein n=1 Tax=Ensete ventricosum TaxID=4639 RepID=A0A426ZE77_ENSVE|nr:hypothetical protein B296_00043529 [Ensete ventricosum]
MKSDDGASSGSTVPSATGAFASVVPTGSTVEKRASVDEGSRYTLNELCKVEDRVGAEKNFATIMTRLKAAEGEDPLVPRWLAISGSSQGWTEGPLSGEYLRGALHPVLAKQVYECSSKELMNRASRSAIWNYGASSRQQRTQAWGPQDALGAAAKLRVKELEEDTNKLRDELESLKSQRRDLEQEVGVLRSSLDGAWNDRAHLEGDVLSLTKAATLLKAELKAEGPRAVATYKVSQGFESELKKMGRVSYEFGYRVMLERLWEKHPELTIEQNPFAECPDDANAEMDLNQTFDDSTSSKK